MAVREDRLVGDRLIVGAAPAFAADTLVEIGREAADVVVSENLLLGSQVAAIGAGVPSASIVPAPSMPIPCGSVSG